MSGSTHPPGYSFLILIPFVLTVIPAPPTDKTPISPDIHRATTTPGARGFLHLFSHTHTYTHKILKDTGFDLTSSYRRFNAGSYHTHMLYQTNIRNTKRDTVRTTPDHTMTQYRGIAHTCPQAPVLITTLCFRFPGIVQPLQLHRFDLTFQLVYLLIIHLNHLCRRYTTTPGHDFTFAISSSVYSLIRTRRPQPGHDVT